MCVCVQSPLGVYSCMKIEGMTVFRAGTYCIEGAVTEDTGGQCKQWTEQEYRQLKTSH